MKTTSRTKSSGHTLLGIAALLVVFGIVFSLAGMALMGGVFVGGGVLLAVIATFRMGRLTIW